jgi:hypothetical protein
MNRTVVITGASSGTMRPGAGGAAAQTADEVAAAIAGVIDRPVAEIYTNPPHAAIVKRYFEDVGRFEAELAQSQKRE